MIRSNLHTHCNFCDGADSMNSLIEKALSLGFTSLGFSSHAYTPFDNSFCIKKENEQNYFTQFEMLKKKYSDKIEILNGYEYDIFSEADTSECDFLIGSVHYIKIEKNYLSVDESASQTRKNIDCFFDSNAMKYACAYYETISKLSTYGNFDIVGHFDLVTKFNEKDMLIDVSSKKYKAAAIDALDEVLKTNSLFEINTGAVARAVRTTPYPENFILNRICEKGGKVIISSDCHNKNYLDFYFNEAAELLKSCGFETHVEMHGGKFVEIPL